MATKLKFSFVLSIIFCQSMFMSLATTTTTTSNGTISATQQHTTSISQEGQTSQISPMSTETTSNSASDGITSSTSVLTTLAQSSITSQPQDLASNSPATTSPLSASNTTVVASNLSPSEGSALSSTVTMTTTIAQPPPPPPLNTTLSSSTPTPTSKNSATNTSANSEDDPKESPEGSISSGTNSTTIAPPSAPSSSDGTENETTQSPSTLESTTPTTIPTTTQTPYGNNCTVNEQCSTKGAECIHTKCSCNASSFFYNTSDGDMCKPKIPYNSTCSLQDQCLTKGAECEGNKCSCNETSFYDNSNNANVCKLKLSYNSTCTEKEQCSTDGADCKTNNCECNSTSYFDESHNTCKLKANHSGECHDEESSQHDTQSKQCKTIGAICKNGTCQCDEEHFYILSNDTCAQRPVLKFAPIIELKDHYTFFILWDHMNLSNSYQIKINVFDMHHNEMECERELEKFKYCRVHSASAGTKYQIEYYIIDGNRDVPSIIHTMFTYTAPLPPPEPTSWERWEKNVTLRWVNISHHSEHYILTITPSPSVGNNSIRIPEYENLHSVTFSNLSGGINYTVTVKAVAGNNTASITSSHYTRPISVTSASIDGKTSSSLDVNVSLNDVNSGPTHPIAYIDPHLTTEACDSCKGIFTQNCDNSFYCGDSSNFTITGLQDGTLYNLSIYAVLDGLTSENGYFIQEYTTPVPPPVPTSWERWEKNVTLRWDDNDHNCEYYILTITPPPSVGNNSVRIPGNEKLHNVTFDNLSGGTLYTVTIKAVAGDNTANITSSHYSRPVSVLNAKIEGQTNSSLDLNVEYNGTNSKQVKFLAYIDPPLTTEACGSCVDIIQNCNETFYCGKSSNFTITGLQDGTLYNLSIYSVLDGLTSEDEYFVQEYTRPYGPSVPVIDNITSSGFDVSYSGESNNFDLFSIKVCFDNGSVCQIDQNTRDTYITVSNLTAATNYIVTVNTLLQNGLESLQPQSTSSFTRPNGPTSVNVTQIHEKNVTIEFNPMTNLYVHIEVDLYVYSNGDKVKTVNGSFISDLQAATEYYIEVFTATITGLRSTENISKTFTTRPSTPVFAEVINRSVNSITYNLSKSTGKVDQYDILDKNGTLYTTIDSSSDRIFRADGLVTGTLYKYKVYANYSGLRSDSFLEIQTYTQPGEAMHLNMTRKTSTSMNSTWNAPDVGFVTHYQWTVTSLGPNKNSAEQTYNNTTDFTSLDINNLESGSICKVTVTSQIVFNKEVISGNPVHIIDWCTLEEGPGKIESLTNTEATSESITIEWEKPSVRNGVIQSYEIQVLLDNIAENIIHLNCASCTIQPGEEDLDAIVRRCSNASVCDNAISDSKFRYNITGLHPFRTYEVTVFARTSQRGLKETSYFGTEESVPSGPPSFTNHTPTAIEIQLTWNSPKYGDRNGIITTYNISYSYMEKTCTDDADGQIKFIVIPLLDNSTSHLLTGLDPYTNYSVKIRASTKVGDGPFSDEIQILTLQSNPSKVRQLNATSQSSESFLLNWVVPCRPNGEITYYTIFLTNTDNNAEWNITSTDTSINVTENILPYSNYSINVIGNTVVGEGDKTDNIKVTTSVGVPRVPKDVMVRNISSTNINVTWTTPELYTGPTNYTVAANDQDTVLHTRNISGFHSTSVNIDGLNKYWLYDITVTAYTSAGDSKTNVVKIRTAEDVPEEVKTLMLTPEPDVTKIRSITVKWVPLTERERNGIINNYFVQYSSGGETLTKRLSSTSEQYVFSNIKPGNYTIKVFASTSIGNGSDHSSRVILEPGAPIKVPEKPGQPLIQKSSVAVADAETQIAVDLPVDTFLCNKTNGDPVEWGVIVAEESAATDEPFVGSRSNYDKTKNQYSKWKDAKGKEPMPPYIATDPKKFNPCGNKGSRRRRDTTSTTFQGPFIVGQDGECPDSSQQVYCNGELPPNRNFRVKSYVCTEGGCTETNYGPSIKTVRTPAPDLTVPIAAGITAAVVVIIVAVVLVTVMKRKQLVCFKKKDVENSSTHQSGEGIEFNRLDSTKSTTSRPFTPGPIKLTDFPGRVEEMHKDSDLIFADAYKMLKEQSPSHPMTAAEAQCSRPKNRYTNILPFDHSRVKLRPSDDVEGSDYINANYIPGYTSRREYIATQGPMLATFDDFWRMIWEQNVDTIVMLTKLMENGRHKCDKYWPEVSEPVYYGDLVVSVLSESNLSDYTIRIIEVKLKEEVKKVHQFCYLKWPDMGCPDTPDLLIGFVNNVRNYTKRERSDKNSGPMIVHCSAGVGRTGTFIAVDTLLQHIRDHDEVDVFNLVKEMRNHRLNMVQTEDQYVYIHECLKAFINTDEDEEDHLYANGPLQEDEHIYENTAFSM